MALRFISDIHLQENLPAITQAFLHYLDNLPEDTEALYLLGDIFDAWLGDDDDNAFVQLICQALKKASARCPIYFMHGNRDFLVGAQFAEKTHCQLLSDPSLISYHGQNYLLMHGDSLCTDDVEYQQFRQQIRNPQMQAMLLAKPLAQRREIAKQLRQNSQQANSNKASDIMDVNPQAVIDMMQQHHVNKLIHGHTHRPAIHTLDENKQRIVLGDWDKLGWQLVIKPQSIELLSFAIDPL